MQIFREHFEEGYGEAAALFKASVRIVEVEISSYCNRVCSFCPNAFLDRRTARHVMDDALFDSIVQQLATIGYDGSFRIHRYNEPLSDRPYALKRVAQIRRALPRAYIFLHTNGDYLDRDTLLDLYDAGVRGIRASAYSARDGMTFAERGELLRDRVERLGFPYRAGSWQGVHWANPRVRDDLEFTYVSPDFSVDGDGQMEGSNRGGALPVNQGFRRTSPCLVPFREMQVEWDGTTMPCCQLRSDVSAHRGAVLGRLTPGADIFRHWFDARHVGWRRAMVARGGRTGPCRSCDFNLVPADPRTERFLASAADHVAEMA